MEQINLYELSYKYIIDASSLISQNDNEPYSRKTFNKLWVNVGQMIKEKKIVVCSEIYEELHDKEITQWLTSLGCVIVEIDYLVQENVRKLVTQVPKMIDVTKNKSSGDAFLIATAMEYKLTVITEEKKTGIYEIPSVCKQFGVDCINISELCIREQWQF